MIRLRERGAVFLGVDKHALEQNIRDFFREKTPVDDNLVEIINKFSTGHKEAESQVNKNIKGDKKKNTRIAFKDAVNGATALLREATGDRVDQEEINRRAGICSGCELNSGTTDCYACGFGSRLSKWVNGLKKVFGKGFIIPNKLEGRYCEVCKCSLAMMLPSKMDAFHETDEKQSERPAHCWVKKESPNFK